MSTCTNSDETIVRWTELPTDVPIALADRRRVIGTKVMVSHVRLAKGCFVPSHRHENEQITCVLSGRLEFGLGEPDTKAHRVRVACAGEVVHLPCGLPHSARALEDTIVLDVFAPPAATTGIDTAGRDAELGAEGAAGAASRR